MHQRIALGLWFVFVAASWAATAQAVSSAEIQRLVKNVTPTYAAPYPEFAADWRPLSLRLLGVDLAQKGASLTEQRPQLDVMFPLNVTCYWLAESELSQKKELELKIASHDGNIFKAEEVKTGPDAIPWNAGSVYQQSFEINLASAAASISGDSMLVLSLFPGQQNLPAPVPLQTVPLYLCPAVGSGRVSARSLSAAIAGDYHDLSASFRLGRNAKLKIPVSGQLLRPIVAIAVVSSFSYGSIPQDGPVCEIIAKGEGGQTHAWTLTSGVDTARCDYDFYAPGSVNHQQAKIVESWDAEYPNLFDKPFKKYKYLAVLPLPDTLTSLVSLEFISKCQVVVDIFDVVLVQEKQE